MKLPFPLLALFAAFLFAGCASTPPPLPVFMGILDAQKIGDGTPEESKYAVVVHYENAVPGQYEIKLGFGYNPSDENLRAMISSSQGVYAIAHSEVLQQPAGDIRVTIEPKVVQKLGGTLNGRIHAILSPYPHGKEWKVTKQDIFVLR